MKSLWEAIYRHSEARQAEHSGALDWRAALHRPHSLVWLGRRWFAQRAGARIHAPTEERTGQQERALSRAADLAAAQIAVWELFQEEEVELLWQRDALGKPYIEWQGETLRRARARGLDWRHLQVSNTHDGDAHLALFCYNETLVGLGIDVVYLPRLRQGGRDADYLHRFARRFMSGMEWEAFLADAAGEDEDRLRTRVAAHFSLMEAASKACGTGLTLGIGLGTATSLSRHALGVRKSTPEVELLFGPEAQARLAELGATRYEAYWNADETYLVSVVALWKQEADASTP